MHTPWAGAVLSVRRIENIRGIPAIQSAEDFFQGKNHWLPTPENPICGEINGSVNGDGEGDDGDDGAVMGRVAAAKLPAMVLRTVDRRCSRCVLCGQPPLGTVPCCCCCCCCCCWLSPCCCASRCTLSSSGLLVLQLNVPHGFGCWLPVALQVTAGCATYGPWPTQGCG